jgi:hypothetical protein
LSRGLHRRTGHERETLRGFLLEVRIVLLLVARGAAGLAVNGHAEPVAEDARAVEIARAALDVQRFRAVARGALDVGEVLVATGMVEAAALTVADRVAADALGVGVLQRGRQRVDRAAVARGEPELVLLRVAGDARLRADEAAGGFDLALAGARRAPVRVLLLVRNVCIGTW